MTAARAVALVVALGGSAASIRAQSLTVGGAVHRNIQRFGGDSSLNRLDGDAAGWMVVGALRMGHWVVAAEGSRDAMIRSTDAVTLAVNARPIVVHSELAHDMRDVAVLGGYARNFSPRFECAVLGGLSAVSVHRAFTTDAGQQVLLPPSMVPTGPVTTTYVDRFRTWTVQADATAFVFRHFGIIGGIRAQPIRLANDVDGRSIRPFAGGVWRFR